MVGAGRQQGRVARGHHPHRVDVRGQLGEGRGDRGGVAGEAAVPVGGEHREVRVDGAAQRRAVLVVADQGPGLPPSGAHRGPHGAAGVVGGLEGAVAGVGALLQQRAAHAFRAAGTAVPLGAAAHGGGSGPQEELPGGRLGHGAPGEGAQAVADHDLVEHGVDGRTVLGEVEEGLVAVDGGEVLRGGDGREARGAQPPVLVGDVRQAGDAAGEQQGGEGGAGLVVGGEAVLVGPPEVGAQHAGAEQRGEAQQVGAVGEGRLGASGAGEEGTVRRGQGGAAPGAAQMVQEEDVDGVGQLGGAFGDGARAAGREAVLGADEVQPAARGPRGPRRSRRGVGGAVGQRDHLELRGVPPGRLTGPVADGGDDDLHVRQRTGDERVEQAGQVVLGVRPVDDDAELGHHGAPSAARRRGRSRRSLSSHSDTDGANRSAEVHPNGARRARAGSASGPLR